MHHRSLAGMMLGATLAALFVVSLTLASCGGGDDDNSSSTTPTVSGAATGPTGPTGARGKKAKRDSKKSRQRSTRSQPRNLTPANSKKQAERVRRAIERARKEVKAQEKKAREVEKKVPEANKNLNTTSEAYSAAKTVCGEFLPDTYIEGKNKKDVARDYAKPWPAKLRDSAYKGCLVGLDQPRPHSLPAD